MCISACGLANIAFGALAHAQTSAAPAKPAGADPAAVSGLVVEGKKPVNRADRRTYDVKNDEDAQNGTAADALNKIPGVSVSAEGGLTLRGDSNVKVLINGRETAMVKGENRALTLLSMSGAAISSIEVMTNPSAQFSADGSGGVINIITRRDAPLGGAGSVRVNVGDGRHNANAVGSYNTGAVTYNLSANVQHNGYDTESASDRRNLNALTGASTQLLSRNHNDFTLDIASATGGIDYRYSEKGTLGGELTAARRKIGFAIDGDSSLYDAAGALSSLYDRVSRNRTLRNDVSGALYWDLRGALTGEGLKVNLSFSRSDEDSDQAYTSTYSLPTGRSPSSNKSYRDNDTRILGFTGDYTKVLGAGELKTGWNVQRDEADLRTTFYALDPLTGTAVLNTNLSNRFDYAQTVSALYATYERPLGDNWLVMAGLRGEETQLELRQVTNGATLSDDYFDVFPSLHFTYVVSPQARWRISYAKRIERPKPQDLNPFVIYRDSQNLTSGNDDLSPQTSHGIEAGYEYSRGSTSYSLGGFYRRTSDLIANATYIVDDTVILTTKDNLGTMSSLGVEASLSMRLMRKVSLNLSTTIYEATIRSSNLSGPFERSALIAEYKMNASYRLDPRNSVTLFLSSQGRRLTREEDVEPTIISSVTYRHDISRRWALSASIQNPLKGQKWDSRTVSDVLRDHTVRTDSGTTFLVGFTRTLGGRA
ncbi:MAG: TonB-dependent receptor [Caulobacter sp.]